MWQTERQWFFCCGLGCKNGTRTKILLPLTAWRVVQPPSGYNVIISDINDIRSLSEGITNYRRKKNMGHIHWYVSVWVKEDKMCRILNCFPTLSEAHSLNPVNDYMRYLRYHLQKSAIRFTYQQKISGRFFFFFLYNPFFSSHTHSPLLSLCLQSFGERLAL